MYLEALYKKLATLTGMYNLPVKQTAVHIYLNCSQKSSRLSFQKKE